MAKRLFTSESVTEGHPDKICDQISDAVLDELLAHDPMSRVACETATTTGMVLVMGEITSEHKADIPKIVRKVVTEIGYDDSAKGFDGNSCNVLVALDEQSGDIAMGVDKSLELKDGKEEAYNLNGAGDQGMMFGYACNETPELMPLPISLAHKLALQLTKVRKDGILPYLRADGKTQVTIEYDDDKPVAVETIVVSSQHSADVSLEQIRKDIVEYVISPIVPEELIRESTKIFVNPTGRFVVGGPNGDSGLTGRKIIVDTYGGYSRHGGGAFSGKDPTKVDRSAAYAARYVAKNVVAAGLADKCEVQLAYAIGVAKPVSVRVDTFGTGKLSDEKLDEIVTQVFDLRPAAIIDTLKLRQPIYRQLAAYGHIGREDLGVEWEKTNRVDDLKKLAGI
ncbi:MAG: methionine adenosyltransferase [Ruminococcaceae bacterium]|nr:methionine adenosyltransferase [Oscillospiraceae bacterium]MBQ6874564.1 methionine adenosyltransferase [Clostridia bacterium]